MSPRHPASFVELAGGSQPAAFARASADDGEALFEMPYHALAGGKHLEDGATAEGRMVTNHEYAPDMAASPWVPIVDLLEEFEYRPLRSGTAKPRGLIVGALALLVSLGSLGVAFGQPDRGSLPWLPGVLVLISGLLFVAGAMMVVRSLSSDHVASVSKAFARWARRVEIIIDVVLAILVALLAALVVLAFVYDADPSILGGFILFLVVGAVVATLLRDRQVTLGLVAIQQQMRAAVLSRWLDTLVLASVLVVPMILAVAQGIDGIAVIFTVGIAVLGAHFQRVRAFDRAIDELIVGFDRIRTEGHLAVSSRGDTPGFYRAVRDLQLRLVRRPRALASPVRWFGLEALCIVADARAVGRDAAGLAFRGAARQLLAEIVHSMSDRDFMLGSAQVFDALLQQADRSPLRRKAKGDLREILCSGVLPHPPARRTRAQRRLRAARPVSRRRQGAASGAPPRPGRRAAPPRRW